MRPYDYKHISAFAKVSGAGEAAGERWRKKAAKEDAPIDAVYHDGTKWVVFADCGKKTQIAIETELNRGR
jgi:hypothetical protein